MILEFVNVADIQANTFGKIEFVDLEVEEWAHPPLIPAVFVKNIGDIAGDEQSEILTSLMTPEGNKYYHIYIGYIF